LSGVSASLSEDVTLVIGGADILSLMSSAACIEVIAKAMSTVSKGGAVLPLRIGAGVPGGNVIVASMPGFVDNPASLGGKLIAVVRDLPHGAPSHRGVVVLFDETTGRPQAILDAHAITLRRTAAASAVATRALARADASRLTILGTGEQADAHIRALLHVRGFTSIRVWGRSRERAEALIARLAPVLRIPMRACGDINEAVREADVVCTVTSSTEPILRGDSVSRGTHVNLVGASSRSAREADDALVARSQFFVDFRAAALAQAGELSHAFDGDVERMGRHIRGEIGDVLNGMPGRESAEEITVYKSLGIAAQDLAAGRFLYQQALYKGVGTMVLL
jgi:ornithine cyclodeaminase/alanine dehydrogenase-like protein (mu-crystallin family)